MLYVFHVDAGTMMTFDMSLAFESVSNLKQYIEKACKIPSDKQVLLVSGGDCLDPSARVNLYSAGTDTNPIYLFSKSVIESKTPPCSTIDLGLDTALIEKANDSQKLPAKIETVNQRTQLAQQFYESASEQTKNCDDLVHDQHLQQQGWAAVVANLEDITAVFRKRADAFEKTFREFTSERETYLSFLQHFNDDLQTLAKIPVLPQLLENNEEVEKTAETAELTNSCDENSKDVKTTTLLEWISASDNKSSMDQLFDHCSKGLEQFSDEVFTALHNEAQSAVSSSENSEMKEVKGLGDRLFGLDQLMSEAKRIVQAQADLAQSFQQNQARVSVLRDSSILPDLCASHQRQLQVMVTNHQRLLDIRKRCTRAKGELSLNLYHRLKWVTYVQSVMLETDQKLVVYHDNLKRLRWSLEVLQQIHLAPATYLAAVAEVVRRRAFSQAFLSWASELACHLLTIHNEEVARRKDFQSQFEGHFLNSLFPGMNDLPPPYATQAPSIFDSNLPKLIVEDIEELKQKLPDLSDNLTVPDITAITNFFLIKSLVKAELDKTDDRGIEEKLVQVVTEVGLASNLDQNLLKPADSEPCLAPHAIPLLKDLDKGCESETDTEEFEKVGQSPLELHFDKDAPSGRSRTQDIGTLTEDNLETSRTEQDKLRSTLVKMSDLATQALSQLRSELTAFKSLFMLEKEQIIFQCDSLESSWKCCLDMKNAKEKETINKLLSDHNSVLEDYKSSVEVKTNKMQELQNQVELLQSTIFETNDKIAEATKELKQVKEDKSAGEQELIKQIENLKIEKEKSIKEVIDKLNRDHKAETDNLRSRFKLMSIAKIERTSSECSESPEDPPSHEALILQIKQNYENEKAKSVKEAIEEETKKWKKLLDEKINELTAKFENEKKLETEEIARRISDEKDKMIDVLREREKNLHLECIKYKSTIQQLAENETGNQNLELIEEIEKLKKKLEQCYERSKKTDEGVQDMGISFSAADDKMDSSTSTIMAATDKMSKGQITLNMKSVKINDTVFVVWDEEHQSYIIAQDNPGLCFLHASSLKSLGLVPKEGEKRKTFCVGVVHVKEHCLAKKPNRYKVPVGTKFLRLKVGPRYKYHEQMSAMSQSQIVEQSTPLPEIQCSTSTLCYSLPSTPVNIEPSSLVEEIEEKAIARKPSSPVKVKDDNKCESEGETEEAKTEQTNVTR